MNLIIFIYNGFIIGMLFSILAFQSQWLEMRMNVGLIIFVTMIVSIIIYILSLVKKKSIQGKRLKIFTLSSLVTSFVIALVTLGTKRIITLPASILREALGLNTISFGIFNTIILLVISVGLIFILPCKKIK